MKNLNAEFIKGAVEPNGFPDHNLPEFCFAGRSNVGKSTLINSIVMRKNLAKTSAKPGKTREINFFRIQDSWILADLPGFGYAAIGRQYREKWENLNFAYLESRKQLRTVFCLLDSRHDPQPKDLELIEWLELNLKKYLIILTKCDKIKPKLIRERKQQIEHLVSQCNYADEVLPYSAISGMGRDQLLAIIKRISNEK